MRLLGGLILAVLTAINEPDTVRVKGARVENLSWDDYLAKVVEKEAGPGFPEEALRAQAVVARTYALHRIARAQDRGTNFDVEAGTLGQAMSEGPPSAKSQNAVEDTRGLVLAVQGRPVEAFFHAACGGRTAEPSDVFHADSPGLSSVKCSYCRDRPNYEWRGAVSRKDLAAQARGLGLPGFFGFRFPETDERGRVLSLRGTGPGSRPRIPLTVLRRIAGEKKLRSGLFELVQTGTHVAFEGKGYGHGVGFCQEGARELARRGRNFRQILRFYFPKAELMKTDD